MEQYLRLFSIASSIPLYFLATVGTVKAQSIQIDGTTPTTPGICSNSCTIEGGLRQGNNLFHSFTRFNVAQEAEVHFRDPGVTNILSRITGSDPSHIMGTLGVLGGKANLFLMNPHGIIFGQNASLDVNGSFVATTANAIKFEERVFFSASASDVSPLLTINPSALFFNQSTNGSIVNRSQVEINDPFKINRLKPLGLKVPDEQSLLLVGGDVILDGGGINAFGGRIALGGLAQSGEVELNFNGNNLNLKFPDDVARANVSVINGARAIVIGKGSGSVAIDARDINISGRDENNSGGLFAGIAPKSGITNSQGGDITLNATGTITTTNSGRVSNVVRSGSEGNGGDINVRAGGLLLRGSSSLQAQSLGTGEVGDVNINVSNGEVTLIDNSLINSVLRSGAIGKGGNVSIKAKSLFLSAESQIGTFTGGRGDAGNILVKTFKSIFLELDSGILSNVEAGGEGNGGEIEIYTRSLSVTSGSQLAASVVDGLPGGKGKGGNIVVNASDSVNLSGYSETEGFPSGLLAATEEEASGAAGNITINTGSLRIADGATVNVQTLNDSDGGNVTINATTFEAVNGGQIINTTGFIGQESNKTRGNAGSITINVSDRITLSGSDPNFTERSNNPEFTDRVQNEGATSGIFASTRKNSEGSAGDIAITTGKLTIRDGAQVSVNSQGAREAGDIAITSRSVELDRALISAETASNTGGNINLRVGERLFLRNGSNISTEAEAGGDGGNIDLDAKFIFAVPNENSNISANAFKGKGGTSTFLPEAFSAFNFANKKPF